VIRSQNFLGFFMSSGFFIAVIFSVLNFDDPIQIVVFALMITFVFYMMLVISVSLFLRTYSHKQRHFQKDMYEEVSNDVTEMMKEKEYRIEKVLYEISKIDSQMR
jgi:uncharacterized membrane protein